MQANRVLVIGGTRFFGITLVKRLIAAGHDVTIATRGRSSDPFGSEVRRLVVDRRDASAMATVMRTQADFDVVFDQMCYSPLDARISCDVFDGRVGHYVMSSTIEAYSHLHGIHQRPLKEDDIDLDAEQIDMDYPWHQPQFAEVSYGKGKRQAEAYFHQRGRLPHTSVRISHVLAGPDDFTGRLSHYVRAAQLGDPFWYGVRNGLSSFTNVDEITRFMAWVSEVRPRGAINAASSGSLCARDIHARCLDVTGGASAARAVPSRVLPSELSPFDYPSRYDLDTSRARGLGFQFGDTSEWLDSLIALHAVALSGESR